MCERYYLSSDTGILRRHFGARCSTGEAARGVPGHVLPGQTVPVLVNEGGPMLRTMRWGFLHACTEDPKDGFKATLIDSTTVADKRDFSIPLRYRRCLIPADAFYLARRSEGETGLARFKSKDGRPFAMAGLWNVWNPVGKPAVFTFAILTVGAIDSGIQGSTGRMPVLLEPARQSIWMSGLSDPEELRYLLQRGPVTSPQRETPQIVEPIIARVAELAATGS